MRGFVIKIFVATATARVKHTYTQEKNMSKTPYEIRLELLHLAKEILSTPVHDKRSSLSDEYHSKLNDANRGTLP